MTNIMRSGKELRSQAALTLLLILCLSFIGSPLSAQEEQAEKVLFVGNSYTYFWNLPQQVMVMAESQGVDLKTYQSTSGGTNWGNHWRGERGLKTLNIIKDTHPDIVILQNHSMRTIDAPDSMMIYGGKFNEMIQAVDAKVYLYMTWAREWDPLMQQTITGKYKELADKIGATLVPVGLAWQKARSLRPDLKLFAEDGSHPSNSGTYLTACVFYGVLTGRSPVGLPERLITEDADGEKLYLNILSQENALFLQKVASQIIESN